MDPNLLTDGVPKGYLFAPGEGELVVHYLRKKIRNEPLPCNKITDINVYGFAPDHLAVKYRSGGEKECYFFSKREKKFEGGKRPSRIVNGVDGKQIGNWKMSSGRKPVFYKDMQVGISNKFCYYTGVGKAAIKTTWLMQEFMLLEDENNVDDLVLCKIHNTQKNEEIGRKRSAPDDDSMFCNDNEIEKASDQQHEEDIRNSKKIRRISSQESSLTYPTNQQVGYGFASIPSAGLDFGMTHECGAVTYNYPTSTSMMDQQTTSYSTQDGLIQSLNDILDWPTSTHVSMGRSDCNILDQNVTSQYFNDQYHSSLNLIPPEDAVEQNKSDEQNMTNANMNGGDTANYYCPLFSTSQISETSNGLIKDGTSGFSKDDEEDFLDLGELGVDTETDVIQDLSSWLNFKVDNGLEDHHYNSSFGLEIPMDDLSEIPWGILT